MTADSPSPLVPKLRFPEFRDDPSWSTPRFSDLYGLKRTNTLSRDKLNYETGTIRNIHYGDIHTKFKPLFRVGDEYVPYVNPDASANGFDDDAFCEEGDIVLADASEDLDDVGKAIEVVSLDGERVVAGTHTILATRRGRIPVVGLGGHLFQSAAVRSGIKKEAQGAKVYGISAKRISAVPIPIPPTVAEQQKIADCLGLLDDLIAAEGWKLDTLQQHKRGLMQQLFPRPDKTVPRLRFPEFRDDPSWSAPRFSDLYGLKRTNTLSRDKLNYETGTIRNIHYGDIHTKFKPLFRVGDEYVPYVNPDASANGFDDDAFCEEGDIVLADASEDLDDVGKAIEVVSLDGERVVAGTHTILATRRGRIPVVGLGGHLFQSAAVRSGIKKEAQGAKVYGISAKRISAVPIPIPPTVAEQQKIADCLGLLDDLIAAEGWKLDTLQQHKRGLMQQLFPLLEANEQ